MLFLIENGGPVMWLLLVCSVLAGMIFLERLLHLHRAQIGAEDFLNGIFNIVNRNNIAEAVSICDETPGPVAHIARAAVLQHQGSREAIAHQIVEAGTAEIPRLERNLNVLLTLAQVAPLLGLLGTVLGMMRVLLTVEEKAPLVHAGDLAGGLWQALITSAAGLAVAIPTYVAYNFLAGRVETIVLDMERASCRILGFLAHRQDTENGA
jgi:biopolymer transport protein ExbB